MTRPDDIRARLTAAHAEQPYEVADRHEIASQAWSDLYQHAPSDIDYLLRQLDTRSHDLRIAEATAYDRAEEIQRLHKELEVENTHRDDAECRVCTHLQHVDVFEENERLAAKATRVEALLLTADGHAHGDKYQITARVIRNALDGDDR